MKKKVVLIGVDGCVPELVEEYAGKGLLPHIRTMMKDGCYSRALPSMTAATPQNWTTIATGAHPGTHGIVDLYIQERDKPLGECKFGNGFSSRWLGPQVEFIWNTLERFGKKAIVMNYACAYPNTMKNGIFVGAEGSPLSNSSFAIRDPDLYITEKTFQKYPSLQRKDASLIDLQEQNLVDKAKSPNAIKLRLDLSPKNESEKEWLYVWINANNNILVSFNENFSSVVCELKAGEWSDFIVHNFHCHKRDLKGAFKVQLIDLSVDDNDFGLYISQVFPLQDFSEPREISKKLTHKFGPFIEYAGHKGSTPEMMLDLSAWQARWLAKSGSYLINNYDCDLLYLKIHLIDHFNHKIFGYIDPMSPWYDRDKKDKYEEIMIRAYQVADQMIGIFREQTKKDIVLILVSDHGGTSFQKVIAINNVLAQAKLISCVPSSSDAKDRPLVDWDSTKAFAVPTCGNILVNLKGRNPLGSVKQEEFECVREKIIGALLEFVDPQNGRHPFLFALTNHDAQSIGLYGPNAGDVIYALNAEYVVEPSYQLSLTNDLEPWVNPLLCWCNSDHGTGLPNRKYGRGSDLGIFVVSGPGIKKDHWNRTLIKLVDVAPTICHILGIKGPRGAEGTILFDFLEE